MKLNKLCIAALVAGTIGVTFSSCKDSFLEEVQVTRHDTEYFKTQDGLDALVTGAYQALKFRYEYQWAYKSMSSLVVTMISLPTTTIAQPSILHRAIWLPCGILTMD